MDEFQAIAHRALMEKEIEHLAQIQNYLGWILLGLIVFLVFITIVLVSIDKSILEIWKKIKE